jgi:hypothetical protein
MFPADPIEDLILGSHPRRTNAESAADSARFFVEFRQGENGPTAELDGRRVIPSSRWRCQLPQVGECWEVRVDSRAFNAAGICVVGIRKLWP